MFSVERELDPPASTSGRDKRDPPATRGDGALAIVSACQLPRHHVLATGNGRDKRDPPALCTTARAHPSCDRLRGSLRSGDMSLLHGHFPRRRGAVATGGTRSRASAFSSMCSLVRRPCGTVPGHQASSRCLRRAIEAASARFVAPSLAKMALTCSLTV